MATKNTPAQYALAAACCIGVVFLAYKCTAEDTARPQTSSPAPQGPTAADARGVCRRAVLARLKAPSTASFAGWTDGDQGPVLVQGSSPPQFAWASWVDAQNSFGARIRLNFSCMVTDGVADLSMEDE